MEYISVFDMLKIGVGPSSSHTLGPWRAAEKWLEGFDAAKITTIKDIKVDLYGSLSLTGKGHATDSAVILGLSGADPEMVPVEDIPSILGAVQANLVIQLAGKYEAPFNPLSDIRFNSDFLPFHSNGIRFTATFEDESTYIETYFSIGGGFIIQEKHQEEAVEIQNAGTYPYPIQHAKDLTKYCIQKDMLISEIVVENEKMLRSESEIDHEIKRVWETMLECMFIGCHTEGHLPGGLNVKRRAFDSHSKLMPSQDYKTPQEWLDTIRTTEVKFRQILKWVSCFALAVNEVNASLGRVVTAPTNGSAGVIPAVLMYYLTIENHDAGFKEIKQFLMVAGEIGSIFKKGATISAAMGGCQAEIGVSSAMAAAALTELSGGTHEQVLMAAEIAMEHHLGMTCDPIGGLVQIPCIERNAMGAIKAINAAEMALDSDPKNAKVPLDEVINTMWETAKDMNLKYKETSQGGLAIKVSLADC